MKNWMIVVAFLVVALLAAPAIAQDGLGDGAPFPKDDSDATDPAPAPVAPAPVAPAPEPSITAAPTPAAPPTETIDLNISAPVPPSEDVNPVSDTGSDGTIPEPGDVTSTDVGDVADTDTGEVTNTDIGPDIGDGPGDGPGDNAREDIVEDLDEDVDADEVDAEDREDRIADRILADLEDDDRDEDRDEDANDEDGVEQDQDQDADSGEVDQDADVINTGDNVNQCVGILQVANTGNAQNATGVTQFDSETDEVELENGSSITLTPQLIVDCRQIILQIVRGEKPNESKISKAKLREAIHPRAIAPGVRTGGTPNRVGNVPGRVNTVRATPASRLGVAAAPKAAPKVLSNSRAGQPKATSLRSLPRTGGSYATLLGLSAGALLIGGGLLARRLAR